MQRLKIFKNGPFFHFKFSIIFQVSNRKKGFYVSNASWNENKISPSYNFNVFYILIHIYKLEYSNYFSPASFTFLVSFFFLNFLQKKSEKHTKIIKKT